MMIKIIIADDEPLVQAGIKSLLNWKELQMDLCGFAKNGEEALQLIRNLHPDIVITDIMMPRMNGLELVKQCRTEFGAIPEFIMLTNYEDFSMVKEALSYHVSDYLIKLEINEASLKKALLSAAEIVDKTRSQTKLESFTLSELQFPKERYLTRLLNNLFESEEQMRLQGQEVSVQTTGCFFTTALFSFYSSELGVLSSSGDQLDSISLFHTSYQMISQLLSKYVDCELLSINNTQFVGILMIKDNQDISKKDRITMAITNTAQMLRNYYKITLYAGIGRIVENLIDLSISFQDSRRIFTGLSKDNPIKSYYALKNGKMKSTIFNMNFLRNDITIAYEEMNSEKLRNVFDTLIEIFLANPDHVVQAMDAASTILFFSSTLLQNGEQLISSIFQNTTDGYLQIYKLTTTQQIIDYLSVLRDGLIIEFTERNKDYKIRLITNVKTYITAHIEKKLFLNEVSAVFGISPNYLSMLFGKYSDTGFIEYVNYMKVQKAKELLATENIKVYEIAERLGFESAFYFSKVFKKVEGISPKEYVITKSCISPTF